MLTRDDIEQLNPEQRADAFMELLRAHYDLQPGEDLPHGMGNQIMYDFDISAPTWRRWRQGSVPIWAIMLTQEWVMKRGHTQLEIAAYQKLARDFAKVSSTFAALMNDMTQITADIEKITRLRAARPALSVSAQSETDETDVEPVSAQSSAT